MTRRPNLSSCTLQLKRFNVSQVVETPRRRKSEYDQAYYLRQESLEVGRAVSTFQDTSHVGGGQAWWRESVFSKPWAVCHCRGGWHVWQHQSHQHQEGGHELGEEDDKRVMVLRKWLRERVMVRVRTIKEIVGDRPQLQQVWGRAGGVGGGWDLLSGGQYGGCWEQQVHRIRK